MNKELTIKGAKIVCRNFIGSSRYGTNKRSFIVYTDDADTINTLSEFGLPNCLEVRVLFNDKIQPEVTLYYQDTKRILEQDSIGWLDYADSEGNIDLIGFAKRCDKSLDEVNGTVDLTVLLCSYKDHNEKTHTTAFLKSMNVTVKDKITRNLHTL